MDKSWTQMILAGNQIKQRGPLRIYLENQDGVRHQRQSFLVTCVSYISFAWSSQPLVPILVAISLPDNMQFMNSFNQIVICYAAGA